MEPPSPANDACTSCPVEAGSGTCDAAGPVGAGPCPACGVPGKPVDLLTVKAMLDRPLTEISSTSYRFCRSPNCPVVYFGEDGKQRITEDMLRVRVHQKHLDALDVSVCYCFRHTPGTIAGELRARGRSSVVEAVIAGIKGGKCACEVRNPQGSCCLGNLRSVVRRMASAAPEDGPR